MQTAPTQKYSGNLGDNVSEAELRAVMSVQPGFRQMKVVKGPRGTTAFVEFVDVASAALVHATLQGVVLQSSERGGVRLQFSKNPFGRRDDAAPDQQGGAALAAAGGGGGSEFAWPTRIDAYELLEPCGTGVRCVRAMGACVGAGGWWWWWCAVCMR